MAGKSIHDIRVTMTADASQGVNQFKQIERRIRDLQLVSRRLKEEGMDSRAYDREIRMLQLLQNEVVGATRVKQRYAQVSRVAATSTQRITGKMAPLTQALGQASFAVEDFMTQFATMGFSGGMRAAGNNISMMVRILGGTGMTGALIGGGAGVAAVALPMLIDKMMASSDAAKEMTSSLKLLNQQLERESAIRNAGRQFDKDRERIKGTKDVGGAKKNLEEIEQRIEDADRNVSDLFQKRRAAAADMVKALFPEDFDEQLSVLRAGGADFQADQIRNIRQELENTIAVTGDAQGAMNQFKNELDSILSGVDDPFFLRTIVASMDQALADITGSAGIGGKAGIALSNTGVNFERALDIIEDVQAELGSDEVKEALQTQLKLTDEQTEALQEQLNAQKLLNDAKKALEESEKGAADVLARAGLSELDQVLDQVRAAQMDLEDIGMSAGQFGSFQDLRDAQDKAAQDAIDKLKKQLPKEVFAGGQQQGADSRESAAAARAAADEMLREAERADDDASRQDIVETIEKLEESIRTDTIVARVI